MRRVSDSISSFQDHVTINVPESVVGTLRDSKEKLGTAGRSVAQRLFDDKEKARQIYRDEVYSLDDWKAAKSWYRHLPSLNSLQILRGYLWIVIFHLLAAVFICCYHDYLVPLGAPGWAEHDENVWQAFNLTSFALALLLVFRTNSSYNRWWESRILWGSQINMTRNIIRMAIAWFSEEEQALLAMFARWSIVMSFALKGNLRGEDLTRELQRLLPMEELTWANGSSHLCNTTSQVLADITSVVKMHEFRRFRIDSELQRYLDIMGSCERILKTPIHRNWTSHTVRFTIIWLTFFPFALWPVYGWATPAIEVVISFLLLGIENIGVQIEEPFAVLALDAYCGVCERSVVQLMGQRNGSKELVRRVRDHEAVMTSRAASMQFQDLNSGPSSSSSLQSGHTLKRKSGQLPLRGSIDLQTKST